MIIFVGHDPGARNHILPIYRHAMKFGEKVHFINLMKENKYQDSTVIFEKLEQLTPNLLISGLSTLKQEWPFIHKSHLLGIPSIAVVDLGVNDKLKNINPSQFPDHFLSTNRKCAHELMSLGAKSSNISIVGSTYLESLSKIRPKTNKSNFETFYKITPNNSLVSFFCNWDTMKSIQAVESFAKIIPNLQIKNPVVVVRPHPRATEKYLLEKTCNRFRNLRYDEGENLIRIVFFLCLYYHYQWHLLYRWKAL